MTTTPTPQRLTSDEVDDIEVRMQKPLNEWPAYDDDNPALSWSVEDRTVLRLVADLRAARAVVGAAENYEIAVTRDRGTMAETIHHDRLMRAIAAYRAANRAAE